MTWHLRTPLPDLLRESVAALVAHRLRATLSAIGIVFGVATVVTALAIGEGARRTALSEIGALGINNVFLRAVPPPSSPFSRQPPPAPVLSLGDAEVIRDTLQGDTAIGVVRSTPTEMMAGARRADGTLTGVNVAWRDVTRLPLASGRWLTGDDERTHRRVAIIGGSLARELFRSESALGSQVRAGATWYRIVGQLQERALTDARPAIPSLDTDHTLIVPLRAMDVSLGRGDEPTRVQEIAVRLQDQEHVEQAAQVIAAIAARRHRGDTAAYELVVPRELLRARLRAQRTFNTVLLAIGALALLISGIGIMNIMLASVAERTQEIGVRRAFGARRSEIVAQFAIEATLLCLLGSAAGIPLGALLSIVVALVAGWPVSVSAPAIAFALLVTTAVGLLAGVYPAKVAASIHPIDALRAA